MHCGDNCIKLTTNSQSPMRSDMQYQNNCLRIGAMIFNVGWQIRKRNNIAEEDKKKNKPTMLKLHTWSIYTWRPFCRSAHWMYAFFCDRCVDADFTARWLMSKWKFIKMWLLHTEYWAIYFGFLSIIDCFCWQPFNCLNAFLFLTRNPSIVLGIIRF